MELLQFRAFLNMSSYFSFCKSLSLLLREEQTRVITVNNNDLSERLRALIPA